MVVLILFLLLIISIAIIITLLVFYNLTHKELSNTKCTPCPLCDRQCPKLHCPACNTHCPPCNRCPTIQCPEKKCPICEKHIGIRFKDPKEKININLLSNTQKIIYVLQNKICSEVYKNIEANLDNSLKNIHFASCKDIQSLVNGIILNISDVELQSIIKLFFDSLINDLCIDGNINTTLLTTIIKDLYDSTCYKK